MNDKLISNYSHLLTQLILLSTGGITAEVTFLSLSAYQLNENFSAIIVIFLAISVLTGIFALIMLFGEARDENPDLDNPYVKRPHLACLLTFAIGFVLFLLQFCFLTPKIEKKESPQISVQIKREIFNDLVLENNYSSLNEEQKRKVQNYVKSFQLKVKSSAKK